MRYTLIDGQKIAQKVRTNTAKAVSIYKAVTNVTPSITVILVGNDPASQVYVGTKEKVAKEMGMISNVIKLPETTTQDELIDEIAKLNQDATVHGILVQLPIPKHIDEFAIINKISPDKDVDGFHPINVGKLQLGHDSLVPCTPNGVMVLLNEYKIPLSGMNAVIVGRSNIVGKPMAALLLAENATVTICHSRTKNLKEMCRTADILVAAVGVPRMINEEYIKEGATVIDVGINRVDGKLCGDVDFDSASKVAGAITPVPKGVGPMTIAMLMQNTVKAYLNSLSNNASASHHITDNIKRLKDKLKAGSDSRLDLTNEEIVIYTDTLAMHLK